MNELQSRIVPDYSLSLHHRALHNESVVEQLPSFVEIGSTIRQFVGSTLHLLVGDYVVKLFDNKVT